MVLAVDYSFARPDPQSLYDAGYRVVLRYLGSDSRCITRAELERLHDVGLMVALVGQSTVTRPRDGRGAGEVDARHYNAVATGIGAPDWLPIFYVCDVGGGFPTPDDYAVIREYASGILATPGRPVAQYGPYPVIEMLRNLVVNGRGIKCWWQTAGGSGSGQGTGGGMRTGDGSIRRLSSLSCMFQHYGFTGSFGDSIDHNDILMDPVTWAWHPDIAETAPDKTAEEDDEMLRTKVIMWSKPGSEWARDVCGFNPGEEAAAFMAYDGGGVIKHIKTPEELNAFRYVGVVDLGFVDDWALAAFHLVGKGGVSNDPHDG